MGANRALRRQQEREQVREWKRQGRYEQVRSLQRNGITQKDLDDAAEPAWDSWNHVKDISGYYINFNSGQSIAMGRNALANKVTALKDAEGVTSEVKAAAEAWLAAKDDNKASDETGKVLASACASKELKGTALKLAKEVAAEKDMLAKKTIWLFGGDGWAYDIGFGGLDHVLASGENVNVFVFDTEVYSNTGGQASKASQIGQVAQFAAAGKAIKKKNLAEIAMSYGYVYVAQVAMGYDMAQTLKAITEAEAYNGPSLIIGYAPCEMHGLKGGMVNCQSEMKRAVNAGYLHTFRFNPALAEEGKNPLTIDSKEPSEDYIEFIESETRYSRLLKSFPERAEELFKNAQKAAKEKYAHLLKLKETYEPAPKED